MSNNLMDNEVMKDMMLKAIAETVPKSLGRGLRKVGANHDDPMLNAVLEILAKTMEEHGAEAVEAVGEEITRLIDGSDPMAAYRLKKQGVNLSDLVDELQDADAERKAKAAKTIALTAVLLTDVGKILAQTALTAIKSR